MSSAARGGPGGRGRNPRPFSIRSFRGIVIDDRQAQDVFTVSGFTRDNTGAILGACLVLLFNSNNVLVGQTTSDATTGAWSLPVPDNNKYLAVYEKRGTPNIAGAVIDVAPPQPVTGTFSITSLSLDGYYKGPFAGLPWTPTASAGASGTNGNLLNKTPGTGPTAGASIDSVAPADFDGSAATVGAGSATSFFSASSLGIIALIKPRTLATYNSTDFGGNPGIVCTDSVDIVLTVSNNGFEFGVSDNVTDFKIKSGVGTVVANTWYFVAAGLSGSRIFLRVNATTYPDVAAANVGTVGSDTWVGNAQDTGTVDHRPDALLMQAIMRRSAFSISELDNIYNSLKTTFPSMALP